MIKTRLYFTPKSDKFYPSCIKETHNGGSNEERIEYRYSPAGYPGSDPVYHHDVGIRTHRWLRRCVQAGFIELFIGLVGIEIHKTTNGTGNYTVEIWAAGKKDTKEAYTTLRDEIRAMQEHITPTN